MTKSEAELNGFCQAILFIAHIVTRLSREGRGGGGGIQERSGPSERTSIETGEIYRGRRFDSTFWILNIFAY